MKNRDTIRMRTRSGRLALIRIEQSLQAVMNELYTETPLHSCAYKLRLSKLLALRLVLDLGVNARRGINSEYAHSVKLRGFADDQDEEYADVDDDVDRFEVCEVNRENGSTTFEVIQTPTT